MVEKNLVDTIPHLKSIGFGKKFVIFTEVARHPNGLSINEIIEIVGCDKPTTWNHITSLTKDGLVHGRKIRRDGKKAKVFKVSAGGLDSIQREMRVVCELYSAIRSELATK